jgi:putative ABC transport system permease protein
LFKDQLALDLKEQGITIENFYPVVRGRLVAINNTPVQQIVSKESQGERAIHRDLSLTWGTALPVDNKIVAGDTQQNRSLIKSVRTVKLRIIASKVILKARI